MLQGSQFGGPSVVGPVAGAGNTAPPSTGLAIQSPADAAAQKGAATTLATTTAKLQAGAPGAAAIIRDQGNQIQTLLGDPTANGGWAQYVNGDPAQGLIQKAITQAQVPGATGPIGQLTVGRSGSPAANLKATLVAIGPVARLTTNLTDFRDMATNLGAGNSMRISNKDVGIFESQGSSLSPAQDQADLIQGLQRYGKQAQQINANMQQSYQDIFGGRPITPPTPSSCSACSSKCAGCPRPPCAARYVSGCHLPVAALESTIR